MTHRALLIVLVAAGVAAGCHEQEPETAAPPADAGPPPRLTAAERRALRVAEGRIETHCVQIARSIVDRDARPSPAEEARAFAAADDFIALARAKPTAELDVGQDLRLFLGDVIENLEGANCDPRMIARLEKGLSTIPAE